jgi:transposase
MNLADEQWEVLEPLIPELSWRADGRGRPWRDSREVLNGILWVLRTGAPWRDLPGRYPPYQTCHRSFQRWVEEGVLASVLEALAEDLEKRGNLDLSECFIDGTFVVAKKGGTSVGKTKRGKGTKLMAVVGRSGLPVSVYTASASPHEVTLVEETLETGFASSEPERLDSFVSDLPPLNQPPLEGNLAYGLGLSNDHGWIGHNGNIAGYNTFLFYHPELDAVVTVEVNSDIASGDCPEEMSTMKEGPQGITCAVPADRIFRALAEALGKPAPAPAQ